MELVKVGTKDGMRYGLNNNGKIVVEPTFESREALIDHYNATVKKVAKEQSK